METDNEVTPDIPAVTPAPLVGADLDAYNAMHNGAVFMQQVDRHWSRFTGPKAAEVLNGLVTNDITKIEVGSGQYAAALAPKGKMLADVFVLRTDPESFLVGSSASGGAAWWSMIRKYVNPRLAQYRDETADLATIGVYGTKAALQLAKLGGASGSASILGDALEEALHAWPTWRHAKWNTPGAVTRLVRVPHLGSIPAFELLVESSSLVDITVRLSRIQTAVCTSAAFEVASIEAGRPLWNADMDDRTIPQEANLDLIDAISFDKGCYTGQETVARIHFRGHVNRHLRGLSLSAPMPVGAELSDAAGKSVGEIRRSAISPVRGPIATALVRREVEPGSTVSATTPDGRQTTATVIALPFPA